MINKALFEEENLYIVGEPHLCEETYAAIRKTIENNQAVGVLAGYYDRDLTIAYISEFFLHNLGYTCEEFMEKIFRIAEKCILWAELYVCKDRTF